MAKKKYDGIVWLAMMNLSGLFSNRPIRCKPVSERYPDGEGWYNERKDIDVDQLGESGSDGYVTFASRDKDEVQIWIDGAMAAMTMMTRWAETGNRKKKGKRE